MNKEAMKFTKTHEWLLEENGKTKIGISNHAQEELGDIVFLDLPEVGDKVEKETDFAEVESVKAASEIYSPVTATVSKINEEVKEAPEAINAAPYDSWLIEVEDVTDTVDLLSYEEYVAFCDSEEG